MPIWLVLVNGPVARFVAVVFILGLLRLVILTAWSMISAVRHAGDRRIPVVPILKETLTWLFPIRHIHHARRLLSYTSYIFHVGILVVSLSLANHLDLLQTNISVAWAPVPKHILDTLTAVTIVCSASLLLHRIYAASSRALSKPMDYLLLIFILNIFVSGFVAGQAWNPVRYDSLMLFHTLNGMLLLTVIPFTKIAHCVLYPFIRLSSEIAWHFTPHGGSRAVQSLYGPEGRKI